MLFKLTHYQPVQIPQSFRKILIHNLVNNLNEPKYNKSLHNNNPEEIQT